MGSLSTDNSESSFQLKMKAFTLILLLVIAYAEASPAAVNKNAKKKLYESLKDESTDEVPCEEDTLEEVVKPIKEKDIIIKDKAIADSRDKEDEIPSLVLVVNAAQNMVDVPTMNVVPWPKNAVAQLPTVMFR